MATPAALRRLLVAGAVFDLAFAVPMLVAPRQAAALLRIDLPPDLTWFRLAGVLLLIVSGCYLAAARAGGSVARDVALVAGLGRLLGCAVLVHAGLHGQGATVLAAGIADGLLGVAHLALAGRRSTAG